MSKAEDLTGQEIGLIRFLNKEPSRNGKTYWNCECTKCGIQKVLQTGHVKSGAIKSCGCKCLETQARTLSSKTETKICKLCGNQFQTLPYGWNRIYCFECSPKDSKDVITHLRHRAKKIGITKLGGKCIKCGQDKFYLLDFHHRNPSEKEGEVSDFSKGYDLDNFFNELEKCDLLCANCHREFHYLNKNQNLSYEEYLNN